MTNEENRKRLDTFKEKRGWMMKALWSHYISAGADHTWERMMGPGFVNMFITVAEDLYPGDKEKQIELVQNHSVFYNNEAVIGSIVPGVVLGLEIERAKGEEIPDELIQSMKAALAGPTAGIGDSIIQGMLVPILTSLAMMMSENGSPLGPIFLLVTFGIIAVPLGFYLFKLGLHMGAEGVETLLSSEIKDRFLGAIQVVGLTVIGAVSGFFAMIKGVKLGIEIDLGTIASSTEEMKFVLQDYIDQLFPGLLNILLVVFVLWLIRKKKKSPLKIMMYFVVIAVIGYFTHILGY